MILLHAVFPLDPEKRDEALDLIADLAEKSRAEPGMIDYRPATAIDDVRSGPGIYNPETSIRSELHLRGFSAQ